MEQQVRTLFPSTSESTALDLLASLVDDADAGRQAEAEEHLLDFADLTLGAFYSGTLVDPPGQSLEAAVSRLVEDGFAIARLNAPALSVETLESEGIAAVLGSAAATLIVPSGRAGIGAPAGTFATRALVTLTPLPPPTTAAEGPLPTTEPQYPPFYQLDASRAPAATFELGVCVAANPPVSDGPPIGILERVTLARGQASGTGDTENLPPSDPAFLDCGALPSASLSPGRRSVSKTVPHTIALGGSASSLGLFASVLASGGGSGQLSFVRAPVLSDPSDRDIWRVDFDGANEMELSMSQIEDVWMAWSPDGLTLAFGRRDISTSRRELWVMAAGGTGQRSLTPGGVTMGPGPPAWSPDGTRLVFNKFVGPDTGLWVINADGSGETQLTFGHIDVQPAWAPDGTSIAFVRDDGFGTGADIWTIDPDGSGAQNLTNDAANDGAKNGTPTGGPEWSPDASRIVWATDRAGPDELFVMSRDGSNKTRLTTTPGADEYPVWHPTGLWLAFQDSGIGRVMVVGADGTGLRALTEFGLRPRWSPDGQWVAFCGGGVYLVGDGGGGQRQLTTTQGDCFIRWRP